MTVISKLLSLLSLATLLILTSETYAEDFYVTDGETEEISSLSISDNIILRVQNNRSYCCAIWKTRDGSAAAANLMDGTPSIGTLENLEYRGRASPWPASGQPRARHCFIFAKSADNSLDRGTVSFPVHGLQNPLTNARVRCEETTLHGGFNTVVAQFNFIEITNTLPEGLLDNSIVATIKATGTRSGTELLNETVTIEQGKRVDINVHDRSGTDFGPVIINHNGPPGSLRAVNAQYKIISTEPLDFEPVLAVEFREGR